MALIRCPECGHQISDQAIACPECGYPLNNSNSDTDKRLQELREQDKKLLRKFGLLFLLGIILILAFAFFSGTAA